MMWSPRCAGSGWDRLLRVEQEHRSVREVERATFIVRSPAVDQLPHRMASIKAHSGKNVKANPASLERSLTQVKSRLRNALGSLSEARGSSQLNDQGMKLVQMDRLNTSDPPLSLEIWLRISGPLGSGLAPRCSHSIVPAPKSAGRHAVGIRGR